MTRAFGSFLKSQPARKAQPPLNRRSDATKSKDSNNKHSGRRSRQSGKFAASILPGSAGQRTMLYSIHQSKNSGHEMKNSTTEKTKPANCTLPTSRCVPCALHKEHSRLPNGCQTKRNNSERANNERNSGSNENLFDPPSGPASPSSPASCHLHGLAMPGLRTHGIRNQPSEKTNMYCKNRQKNITPPCAPGFPAYSPACSRLWSMCAAVPPGCP